MEDKAPHCGVTHVSATTELLQEKAERTQKEEGGEESREHVCGSWTRLRAKGEQRPERRNNSFGGISISKGDERTSACMMIEGVGGEAERCEHRLECLWLNCT